MDQISIRIALEHFEVLGNRIPGIAQRLRCHVPALACLVPFHRESFPGPSIRARYPIAKLAETGTVGGTPKDRLDTSLYFSHRTCT